VDVVLPHHPELRRDPDEAVRFFPYRYAPDRFSRWGYAQSLEADVRVRPSVYLLAPLAALALRHAVGGRLVAERYDVVHAHWVVPNAAIVRDVVASHDRPFVVSLHGSDVFLAERSAAVRPLARDTLRTAGAVTACSSDLAARGVALGAIAARVRTVPYGVDAEAFAPAEGSGGRALFGVPAEALFVLAVGRLVEKKGFTHLVDAVARTPGAHLLIAGAGDLRARLERRAQPLAGRVRFTGTLDRETVARALAAADVVAVPSVVDRSGNVDGLPNVLLEALAAGRAVVASRVAGMPDVVTHDLNGLLVPPGDPAALAEALERLRDDAALRTRLGAAARRDAAERLSWEAAARAFEECYAQAAALVAR
jgi:glycosyltransferase involved in cell wall biosynthesis